MKLAVSGKGGVGKTTISALLSCELKSRGHDVIAIDADPDSNLLSAFGSDAVVPPLVELKKLIEERTGVKPGTTGGMFRLNPQVDDIPDQYGVDVGGVKVLIAGAVKKGGTGCYCPENAFIRALVSHLLLEKNTALILDMEAGVEHLGRGTVQAVDNLVVIVEPGKRSVDTALRIKRMATELGMKQICVIGNRIRSESDKEYLKEAVAGMDIVGFVPFDDNLLQSDRGGGSAADASEAVKKAIVDIVDKLDKE